MKRIILILLSILAIVACDIDINLGKEPENTENSENMGSGNPSEESTLDRELIYGTWKITHAKYSEDAKLTEWEHEDTYATFKENGIYEGEGYWGNGEGTYSISGKTITTYIDNEPYIEYEVITITESGDEEDLDISAEIIVTLLSSKQTVWINCIKVESLDITPDDSLTEESLINSESDAMMAIAALYMKVRDFSLYQHYIEYLALTGQRDLLKEDSQLLYDAWLSAYTAITPTNNIIEILERSELSWAPKYLSHAKVLRAFVYYNLAVLWGDVPYVVAKTDELFHPRTKINEIITNEISTIENVYSSLEQLANSSSSFSKESCKMLLAEMYLCKGDKASAKNSLKNIETPNFTISIIDITSPNSYFLTYGKEIWGDGVEVIAIYDVSLLNLYNTEINGEISDISTSWNRSQYGKWAMLKRLGKAQDITGCKGFELLMPIPSKEMINNPKLTQNEGYH